MSAIEAARGRLSYLPFVARATIAALREYPMLNATLEGDRLTVHERGEPRHRGVARRERADRARGEERARALARGPGDAHQGPRRAGALQAQELERQHAHAHQVGAVDPFVALREHGPHAKQAGALGRPVAGAAAAVLGAADDQQRDSLGGIAHGGVVDGGLLAAGLVGGEGTLAGAQRVAQTDVAERPPHHDLVVPTSRTVAVELVKRRHAMCLQPLPGRAPRRDGAGGRDTWSVVTESPSTARARAPRMSVTGAGDALRPSKKGGRAM